MLLEETQRIKWWWVWAAVIGFNLLFAYAIIQQVVLGVPFGEKPASDGQLILFALIPVALLIFLLLIRLKTKYTEEGIYYRFYPFQLKTTFIAWHELTDVYMREYRSFYEFGGWGIRKGRTGNAINTSQSGTIGLQLQFHNGRLLLIGTRQPDALGKIVEEMIRSGKINRAV
ncbi:MAG: hypothetical protein U0X40_10855 [Ferruginibacter sp.]